MKRILICILVLIVMLSSMSYASDMDATAKYLAKQELDYWGILSLYSHGSNMSDKSLEIEDSDLSTDVQGYLLGAAALEKNVLKIAKQIANSQRNNGKLSDFIDGTGEDYVNAHIWGVISLYAAKYEEYDKEKALKWLKENQNDDGGFSIYIGTDRSDVDMTSMGLVAYNILGLDKNSEEVQKAIAFLDENLEKKESCEGYAWYILAKVKLGLDIDQDILDSLMKYKLSDGSFKHLESFEKSNYMATWHGLLASTDYNDKTSIFDELHNAERFVDLGKTDDAYTEVMGLVKKGVISGYSDNTFKPNALVKRSEFSKFLVYGLGLQNKISNETQQFNDLKGHWSNKIVNVAVKEQLIKGKKSNEFAPEAQITGAEVATMLVRAKGLEDKAEAIQGANWYDGYVQVAKESGLLYDNFNPKKYATRAECAEAVYKLIEN